jgi:hypothetical protein
MASKIRLSDGRELTVSLDGKRVVAELEKTVGDEDIFARFSTPTRSRVWVNPLHVASIEDRPDID